MTVTSISYLALFVSLILTSLIIAMVRRASAGRHGKMRLPPGPRPLPIIGNVFDIPTRNLPKVFQDMSKIYGDVVYFETFGQPMIVLGTHEVAVDLLEKRSAKYSDRVHSTMAYLTGWDWALPIIPYGAWWRRSRRAFHEHFNASVIVRYRAVQLEAMGRFLRRLLESPEAFERHIKHFIASSTIRLAYGVDVDKEEDTPYLEIATAAVATFAATFVPGKYLVETFPALRFLPSWMPGAQFKRDGQAWKPRVRRLQETPWNACMSDMRAGTAPPSIVATMVEHANGLEGTEHDEEMQIANDTAAAAYAGGSDTLFTTLMTFFLAMASYPEIQTRAQAELDAVVGTNRLPHFDDAGAAPYVVALMKECTRWRVVIPFGILHRSTEEDVYRGRRIPKGTIVVPNQWAFTREERYYPDPEEFRPERYLKEGTCDPGVLDPGDIIFGYGRRACPGRDFAQAELFVVMASVLHAFTIRPARDAHGVPIPLESAMSDGALSVPSPFKCAIVPRSGDMEALIRGGD